MHNATLSQISAPLPLDVLSPVIIDLHINARSNKACVPFNWIFTCSTVPSVILQHWTPPHTLVNGTGIFKDSPTSLPLRWPHVYAASSLALYLHSAAYKRKTLHSASPFIDFINTLPQNKTHIKKWKRDHSCINMHGLPVVCIGLQKEILFSFGSPWVMIFTK